MHGKEGAVARMTDLPSQQTLNQYDTLELDMALTCPGTRDEDCAIWDHTVQLFVCCHNSPPSHCGQELGRWITPFRRRIGRWTTLVSQYRPLISSSVCNFTIQTAWWAKPWVIGELNLRFSKSAGAPVSPALGFVPSVFDRERLQHLSTATVTARHGNVLVTDEMVRDQALARAVQLPPSSVGDRYGIHEVARSILPLFRGGTFDSKYNSIHPPVQFTVPAWATRTVLAAVITGHGSDNNGCGEFCVTSHTFSFTDYDRVTNAFTRTFSSAGSPFGCADMVRGRCSMQAGLVVE